jgi:hypothetical protein
MSASSGFLFNPKLVSRISIRQSFGVFLLGLLLLLGGMVSVAHDCSHHGDDAHHDCAICLLAFSSAETSGDAIILAPELASLYYVPDFHSGYFSGLTSSSDPRAPPSA